LPQYLYFLVACTGCSLVFGYKSPTCLAKTSACFFLILFVIELICSQLSVTDGIYNFWYPIEFGFYSFFIHSYLKYQKKGKLLLLPFVTILYCYFYHFFHWNLVTTFFTLGYSICCSCLFVFIIIKTYELLTDENDLRFPFKIPLFWFLLGLILNLTSFLLFGMKNYILSKNYNLYIVLQYSNQILSSLQYLCFIIYFYCSWKYQNWNL
jgi:hypothetical protein